MPEQTQTHLDDTDRMLLGEMAVKALTPEQVTPKTNGHDGYHDHDTHEHIREHEYNPLTATHGTLVVTDRKGGLVQGEKVSRTMLRSLVLLSLVLPLIEDESSPLTAFTWTRILELSSTMRRWQRSCRAWALLQLPLSWLTRNLSEPSTACSLLTSTYIPRYTVRLIEFRTSLLIF